MKKVKITYLKPVFTDYRGRIFNIIENRVGHIGIVTFSRKGLERGNHYHKKSIEYVYVLEGRIKLIVSDVKGKNRREFILKEGTFVIIPSKIIHIYVSLTEARILDAKTISYKRGGYEKDTVKIF